MKIKKNDQECAVTAPLLDDVMKQDKANHMANFPAPSVGDNPLPSPDLYQDSGSGYNANFTFPQD